LKIKIAFILLILIAVTYGVVAPHLSPSQALPKMPVTTPVATEQDSTYTPCGTITDKTIVVSIKRRHMWACQDGASAYDSAVVTGDMNNAENLTPTGSYKIYAKQTNTTLRGSDTKGTWDVHVNYWMPFLHNQYGTYGFHDATWRDNDEFGNVDPYSSATSHGCVELPLATGKWLYDWAAIGTTVTVQD